MNAASIAESADEPDRIGGKSLFALFGRLKEERTPLQFTVFGRNYERLSLVTCLKRGNKGSYVLIDSPPRLEEDLLECEGLQVRVEFLDRDHIQYAFRSHIAYLSLIARACHLLQSLPRLRSPGWCSACHGVGLYTRNPTGFRDERIL